MDVAHYLLSLTFPILRILYLLAGSTIEAAGVGDVARVLVDLVCTIYGKKSIEDQLPIWIARYQLESSYNTKEERKTEFLKVLWPLKKIHTSLYHFLRLYCTYFGTAEALISTLS